MGFPAWGQTPKEPPPAPVQVAPVHWGKIQPQTAFVGTVVYPETAEVATEVNGLVERVNFEEGDRVTKGALLVTLNADLLRRNLEAAVAAHREAAAERDKTRLDYQRMEKLLQGNFVSAQSYDEARFRLQALENRTIALRAATDRLQVELERKSVRAPFDGVILRRHVDRGEWVAPGTAVASIARDDVVDVTVDVPERIATALTPGLEVRLEVAGRDTAGKIFAVIPRGDVTTRTFPIKVRIPNSFSLIQGMEARVNFPSGDSVDALLVPRDAVLTLAGQNAVFAVLDSRAHMIPVRIVGYEGMLVGVAGEPLEEGMTVVIKGNERLREGQAVLPAGEPRQG
jgi:RND family efflux transporter MFP subunit